MAQFRGKRKRKIKGIRKEKKKKRAKKMFTTLKHLITSSN